VQQSFKQNESARMGALMKNESVKERKVRQNVGRKSFKQKKNARNTV
jgi:hypothetical protein